jgi:nucleoid-associated protein YgaU
MGFMDSIKNALGGGKKEQGVKGPSTVLREAGIDPENMKFEIKGDGTVNVNGYADSLVIKDRVTELVSKIPAVSKVNNNLQVGAPPAAEPEPHVEPPAQPAPEPATVNPEAAVPDEADVAAGDTYTVQAGDSLWKISEEQLGSGARYMEIFQANTDILENPDLIKPGQVLKIPKS